MKGVYYSLSRVWLFMTPWTVAQAPPSMGFSRQEYWSGLQFPSPGESSPLRDQTQVSHTAGRLFMVWATREDPVKGNWIKLLLTAIACDVCWFLKGLDWLDQHSGNFLSRHFAAMRRHCLQVGFWETTLVSCKCGWCEDQLICLLNSENSTFLELGKCIHTKINTCLDQRLSKFRTKI